MFKIPPLPELCTICLKKDALHLVPDRCPEQWRFDGLCPLCLDSFLSFFPITIKKIQHRETHGTFYVKHRQRCGNRSS